MVSDTQLGWFVHCPWGLHPSTGFPETNLCFNINQWLRNEFLPKPPCLWSHNIFFLNLFFFWIKCLNKGKKESRAVLSSPTGPHEVQKFNNMTDSVFLCCLYFFRVFWRAFSLHLAPPCSHTMVSSVIFLVNFVGTERWVVCTPFMSGMSRRTFWLVLLHSEYSWQWYRKDTWGKGQCEGQGKENNVSKQKRKDAKYTVTMCWSINLGKTPTPPLFLTVYWYKFAIQITQYKNILSLVAH